MPKKRAVKIPKGGDKGQAKAEASPKAEPVKKKIVKEKKKSQGKDPKAQSLDAEEVQRITKMAIDDIKSGIKDPNAQKKTVFVPEGWGKKYKPVLGNYKTFLSKCGEFAICDDTGSNFVIKLASDPTAQQGHSKTPWKIDLIKAWDSYTTHVPKDDRSLVSFAAVLKDDKSAQPFLPGGSSPKLSPKASPKLAPAGSPKLSPKASPALAAAAPGKKKKAKKAAAA